MVNPYVVFCLGTGVLRQCWRHMFIVHMYVRVWYVSLVMRMRE